MIDATEEQIKEQLQLEGEILSLGADAYDTKQASNRQKKRESLCPPGNNLAALGVAALCENIEIVQQRKTGKYACYLEPLAEVPAEVAAAIAMRVVLDRISQERKANALALAIGAAIWAEAMLLRAGVFDLKDHLAVKRWRNGDEYMAAIKRMETSRAWTTRERQSIGIVLLQLVATHTGIIKIEVIATANRRIRLVNVTDECMTWLENEHARYRMLRPMRLPMLIKPRPWTNLSNGGYLTPVPGNTLLKDARSEEDYTTGTEPFLLAANKQQQVGWCINRWVQEQASYAWQRNIDVGCMVRSQGYEIPPFPKHLERDDPDAVQWRHNARIIHERNDGEKGRRIQIMKTLWVADRFKDRDAFYYPMQVDFRGRFYYRCYHLNPQGNDLARSLLQFAVGTPIQDDAAAQWLMVHGANAYGLSRESWGARAAWVQENEPAILASAVDPWGGVASFWHGAKSPWQFLAFCREWYLFRQQGFGYVSRLAVQLDCTCSGIQHFAALLRDEGMASMVNLTPAEQPRDIYTELTERVLKELRGRDEDDRAIRWLRLNPDRSLTKPVVMTLAYSATRRSVMQHCQEWAHDRGLEQSGMESWPFQKGGLAACYWMSDQMYTMASNLIASAASTMSWFQKLGSLAGKNDIPLEWTSPSGMRVVHKYPKYLGEQIYLNTLSSVRTMRTSFYDNEQGLATRRMGNGLSPNLIHSLDSAHMSLTVNAAIDSGIVNVGGIHDCFLTTAAEMSALRQLVRATFVEMYTSDLLGDITQTLLDQIPEGKRKQLPALPEQGGFDLSQVLSADYFIS